MKPILLLLFLPSLARAQEPTRLRILQNGLPSGYATIEQSILPDGSKLIKLRMQIGTPEQQVRLATESLYDKDGKPVTMSQEVGRVRDQANFDASGAIVTHKDGGSEKTRAVTLVETAPRSDGSQFWFVRDQPTLGQSIQTYQFGLTSGEWELVQTQYMGEKQITTGGRQTRAHVVISHRNSGLVKAYLDDRGEPVLIEQGSTRMERMWDK